MQLNLNFTKNTVPQVFSFDIGDGIWTWTAI